MSDKYNIKEFEELLKKYSNITIGQIEYLYKDKIGLSNILHELTGFGSSRTCILCKNMGESCKFCLYNYRRKKPIDTMCLEGIYEETYDILLHPGSCKELYDTIQKRIKIIRRTIKKYYKYNNK